ncbi:hypothetical protein DVH24_020181 [Malus domestica]|uniref:Protein TIC 20 n=1 Tax=Malus domestica TaxID=3750 RepID=A0A498J676_MALDO|nr:hypothetical protein DVH24_020181 [Malus domestica]
MTGMEFKPQNRMFIAGMGFVGQRLGRELKNHGWDVSGTCTRINKKKKLEEERSFQIYLIDANEPDVIILDAIKNHTHMVVSIPPVPGIGDPMLDYEQILRRELVGGNLQWLGYLSSTTRCAFHLLPPFMGSESSDNVALSVSSKLVVHCLFSQMLANVSFLTMELLLLGVYGDTGGAWVDEDYIPNPASESGRLRLAAEEGWFNFGQSLGISTQVFRLGGIYGPGRSAVDTIVKQGALSESQRMRGHRQFTSRVSVDDICQAIMASICTPSSRRVYNIVDDDPAPREEVFEYARDLVEKKWPGWIKQPSEQKESSEPVVKKRGLRGEKRVSNARMKKELGVRLLHPSYRYLAMVPNGCAMPAGCSSVNFGVCKPAVFGGPVLSCASRFRAKAAGFPCLSSWRAQQEVMPLLNPCAASSPFFSRDHGSLLRTIPALKSRCKSRMAPQASKDVPYSFRFPPMTKKPKWWWRMLACLPYLMPLHETWMYAETAYHLHPFLEDFEFLTYPFLGAIGRLPSWFLMAYFFVAYLGVVRRKEWPHFFRFHVVMGMLLEIALQVIGTVSRWMPLAVYWGKVGMHFWTAIAFAYLFTVLEAIRCALAGMYADIPFVCDAAYIQIPYD